MDVFIMFGWHALSLSSRRASQYPTQKPLALLERIIQASGNPGDMVLGRFAAAARLLQRRKNW
ncbi:MAG: DNA methyltransferase [Anaerolineae bacterium]